MISPQVRRSARERAVQFLFGIDFTGYSWDMVLEKFWEEFPCRVSVKEYAEQLIRGVAEHQEGLDEELVAALDHWTPDRVGHVERAILRVALYEMRHEKDVPPAVAINEAIEIAKRFGADEAPRFINGVLDRLKKKPKEQAES